MLGNLIEIVHFHISQILYFINEWYSGWPKWMCFFNFSLTDTKKTKNVKTQPFLLSQHLKRTLFRQSYNHMTKNVPMPANPHPFSQFPITIEKVTPPLLLFYPPKATHAYSQMCPQSGLSWDGSRPWVWFNVSSHFYLNAGAAFTVWLSEVLRCSVLWDWFSYDCWSDAGWVVR